MYAVFSEFRVILSQDCPDAPLSASEQMYYLNAPVAHVVEYEAQLLDLRRSETALARRLIAFASEAGTAEEIALIVNRPE